MTTEIFTGPAIVYCDGAFNTPEGKTAHGLVRFTKRFDVKGIIDARYDGQDAGEVLDGRKANIPIYSTLDQALDETAYSDLVTNFVIGLAPDGGRLNAKAREVVYRALERGINVVSGLHDFISNDERARSLAAAHGVHIKDVRKTPGREELHFFTGAIETVDALKIAILGTDSAVGKRTTAWKLVQALSSVGVTSEMIGTGQTAWMQGARYTMIMDSCINDFVSGEIENAVVSAFKEQKPDVIVIEGQGSLMNPAYPGGFEILAAGRPDYVIMQHAPRRLEYDGFPGYPIHDLDRQIEAVRVIADKSVIAITLNHEGMAHHEIDYECQKIRDRYGLPCFDPLYHGDERFVDLIQPLL